MPALSFPCCSCAIHALANLAQVQLPCFHQPVDITHDHTPNDEFCYAISHITTVGFTLDSV